MRSWWIIFSISVVIGAQGGWAIGEVIDGNKIWAIGVFVLFAWLFFWLGKLVWLMRDTLK